MSLRPNTLDTSGRRLLESLLHPDVNAPARELWDFRTASARIRAPLLREWPFRGARVVLASDAAVPPAFRVALELDGALFPMPPSAWTTPHPHDVSSGWTYRASRDAASFVDVDGLSAWSLATPEDPQPPGWRVFSSLGRVIDLYGAPDGLASVTALAGRVDVAPDDEGRVGSVVLRTREAHEELARLHRDAAGLVRTIERPGRGALEIGYDAHGRIANVVGENGSVRYEHVGVHEGRVGAVRIESPALGRWEIIHPAGDQVVAVDASRAAAWSLRFDAAGRVLEQTTPDGIRSTIERDADTGAPVELARGSYRRHFYYDAEGFVVLADDSLGVATELRYDPAGRLIHAERGEKQILRRAYDLSGRLSTTLEQELGWSQSGELTSLRDLGGERRFACNAGEIVERASGQIVWRARRDRLGHIVELSGPEGEAYTYQFSRDGEPLDWHASDGFARRFASHPGGALIGYRDEADEVTWMRDAAGRLCSIPQHDVSVAWRGGGPHIVGRGLDLRCEGADLRASSITRDDDVLETLTKDELGRPIRRSGGGRPELTLAWSATGALARCDVIERVATPSDDRRTSPPIVDRVQTYLFEQDDSGLVVRASVGRSEIAMRRARGRIVEQIVDGARTGIARDDAGFRLELRSSRGLEVEYRRDASHHLRSIAARFGGAQIEIELTHDRNGLEVSRAMEGVQLQLMRDSLGRLVRRRVVERGRVLDTAELTWRGGRLARLESSGAFPSLAFHHSRAGVVLTVREGERSWQGAEPYRGPAAPESTYDDAGRPRARGAVTYDHDDRGRLEARRGDGVARFEYDAFDRLVRVERPYHVVSHVYDALGRRAQSRASHEGAERLVEYVWDGLRLLHRDEQDVAPIAYVYGDGVLLALFVGPAPYLVVPDADGSPAGLITADGGLAWTRRPETLFFGAVDDDLRKLHVPAFAGAAFDDLSGLWFSARGDFDPETARYLQPGRLREGPWLYAAAPDPFAPDLTPWHEIEPDGFDALWASFLRENLSCDHDAPRAWRSLAEKTFPDPEHLLLDER